MRGLTGDALTRGVQARLDHRLASAIDAPVALALSGGGDSVALALIASDWARRHGRRVLMLTVDHGLNPLSATWTAACAELAARLDADFQALVWTGAKPDRGLPAAARAARHALLGDAARIAGARVLLMAHTGGDLAETAIMREVGSTTPSPREWAPSPAWPQGRGVFLLRPMLHLGRAEIRAWLSAQGATWIEDPANADLRYARARARAAGSGDFGVVATATPIEAALDMVEGDRAGVLRIPRGAATPRLTALACLCAAGATRPPRTEALTRIAARMRGRSPWTATLAGARIDASADHALFLREPGELRRRPPPPLVLAAGEVAVWDGRFELAAARPARISALAGLAGRLPREQQAALRAFAPRARAGLPIDLDSLTCPLLAAEDDAGLRARPLALERLAAAGGAIQREPV